MRVFSALFIEPARGFFSNFIKIAFLYLIHLAVVFLFLPDGMLFTFVTLQVINRFFGQFFYESSAKSAKLFLLVFLFGH